MEDMLNVKNTLQTGQFPTDSYITHKVNYKEMINNFESWLDPNSGVIKAMVSFSD